MEHYQKQYKCSICKREFVVDILSIGTEHQTIQAITCLKCGKKVGGRLMGKKRRTIEFRGFNENGKEVIIKRIHKKAGEV